MEGVLGGGGWGEIVYLSLHCHHQNDSCIKMDSDESHFNVSLIVRDEVTRQCPQTTTFEEKGESKGIRTDVPLSLPGLPLGQTGSLSRWPVGATFVLLRTHCIRGICTEAPRRILCVCCQVRDTAAQRWSSSVTTLCEKWPCNDTYPYE